MSVFIVEGLYVHADSHWTEAVFDSHEKALNYIKAKMDAQDPEDDRFFVVGEHEVL